MNDAPSAVTPVGTPVTGNWMEPAPPVIGPPAIVGPSDVLSALMGMARDPSIDPERIKAFVMLHRELEADQAKRAFNEAFATLSAALPRITKKGEVKYPENKANPTGPQIKAFNYAKWEDIDAVVRPLLIANDFSLSFNTTPQPDGRIVVHGRLSHLAGHHREVQIGPLPLDTSGGKNNIQALGSTTSYGKRYCGTMLLNLIFEGEDDDGVKGGTILIDAASVKQLSDLIRVTSSNLDIFLNRFMKVETLADIQLLDFPRAINALMSKMTPEQLTAWRAEQGTGEKK